MAINERRRHILALLTLTAAAYVFNRGAKQPQSFRSTRMEPNVTDNKRTGEEVWQSFGSKVMDERIAEAKGDFAQEMKALSIENVFSRLWGRPGLDARSRSLVTLGILIALRATDELKLHAVIAHNNGLTISELEEVFYHSTGYAGFPAATAAVGAASEALRKEGLLG